MSQTVADVLNGAADLIERDGWVQGQSRGEHGERCAANALWQASGEASYTVDYDDVYTYLVLAAFLRPLNSISHWNDAPRRTKEEVVATLRAAAEQAS